MVQWVSVANWKASLIETVGPASPTPKRLQVEFEIANESNFPLSMDATFKFFGKLPGAATFGPGENVPLFPRKPYKCKVELSITEEQSKQFLDFALRFAVYGEITHVGVANQQSPLMSIRGNLVCGQNRPTELEYESIRLIPKAQTQTDNQSEGENPI